MEPTFVAIESDGEVEIHAESPDGNSYATLCGLDGDDFGEGSQVNQRTVELPKRPKITCVGCQLIIETARKYKVTW